MGCSTVLPASDCHEASLVRKSLSKEQLVVLILFHMSVARAVQCPAKLQATGEVHGPQLIVTSGAQPLHQPSTVVGIDETLNTAAYKPVK